MSVSNKHHSTSTKMILTIKKVEVNIILGTLASTQVEEGTSKIIEIAIGVITNMRRNDNKTIIMIMTIRRGVTEVAGEDNKRALTGENNNSTKPTGMTVER